MLRNQTLFRCIVSVFGAWLFSAGYADSWSAGGHRVVANIAYDQLEETTRDNIVAILRKHPDFLKRFKEKMPGDIQAGSAEDQDRWIFLQASIWPDLVYSIPKYKRSTWHYINLPFYLSELDRKVLEGEIKPNIKFTLPKSLKAAEQKKFNCVQAFKFCLRELADAHTPDPDKAIYYCWVLHIGGDIHQPLHSTSLVSRGRFNESEGDRGGNGVLTKQGSDLHSYWDALLGKEQTLNQIRGRAADILLNEDNKKAATAAKSDLKIDVWVRESHKLAKDFVYTHDEAILKTVAAGEADSNVPLPKVDLSADYRKKAGPIAQRRAAEAGYRLGEILK